MAATEERIAKVEGVLEEVRVRLSNVEAEVRLLRQQSETRFYWLLGLLTTMWVTLILAIMFKG